MLDNIFQHRGLMHVLYWLGILIAYPVYALGFEAPMLESFLIKLGFLPGQILATYLLIYFQIPVLIYQKRYGLLALSFLVGIYVFPVLAHLADDYLIVGMLGKTYHQQHTIAEILSEPLLAYYQIAAFLIPFSTAAIKLVKQSLEERQELEQLKQEKTNAELQLLKAKIHPHFLFNTLDHLHELTLQKSDAAPELVVKLSEMLDYTLYQVQDQRVPLSKEVFLLQNYLDLQVLQYGERFSYQLQHEIKHPQAEVAPLLLLSLLESVLAGRMFNPDEPLKLSLSLENDHELIYFQISLAGQGIEGCSEDLDNVRWQLALSYPSKHKLEVKQSESLLSVEVSLGNELWLPPSNV